MAFRNIGGVLHGQGDVSKLVQLHLRFARGETLSNEDSAAYRVGLADLERDEQPMATIEARELRQSLTVLQKEHAILDNQRQELDAEIAVLESRLSGNVRQFLGVEE